MRLEKYNLKQDKGVAGLTVLLSVITMIFVMGLLIAIFSLMGGGLKDATALSASETSGSITQNVVLLTEAGTTLTTCNSATEGTVNAITSVINRTGASITINPSNYTFSGCKIYSVSGASYNGTTANVTYTFTYAGTAYEVANDTVSGIGGAVGWFDIFIVITAMVVLILLTVIIITAIRGSGLMVGNTGYAGQNVGSA